MPGKTILTRNNVAPRVGLAYDLFGNGRTAAKELGTPNADTVNVFLDNIANRRSDTAAIVDLRVDKSFSVAGGARITGMIDLYNALNANTVTNFFVASGSTYDTIIAALNPRTMQVGIRLTF